MGTVIGLMYLADIAANLQQVFCASGILGLLGCGGYLFVMAMNEGFEPGSFQPKKVRGFAIACVISLIVAAAIPSQQTLYAAAATVAGEKAIHTPTGSKAIQALNAWLDEQIAKPNEKKN